MTSVVTQISADSHVHEKSTPIVTSFHRMADEKSRAMSQLKDITECCICLKTFTDPRMLPCIHTFCFQCLQDMAEKSDKKPGDLIQCPVCRKEFAIPSEGVLGVQKNFFMAAFLEVRNTFNQSKKALLTCDVCKANNDATDAQIAKATMQCLVCQENLCEGCCKMHKSFKISKNHKILKIGSERDEEEEEAVKSCQVMNCDIHSGKVLDYYCADCKKVVCVSCFVESHKTHDCKDVNTVDEEFRIDIENNAQIISSLAKELLGMIMKMECKEDYLKKIATRKREILDRSKELKDMIEEHTKSLVSSLDEIKNRHLKEIQMEEDELDIRFTALVSFSRYCDELRSKGSASEVCRSKDELLRRADELEEDHETYIMRPHVSFDVTFLATDLDKFLETTNGNFIGSVNEKVDQLEDVVVMIGINPQASNCVIYEMNLIRQSVAVSIMENVPDAIKPFAAAAVFNNTMYVTGFGETLNEIWKYSFSAGWKRCGSLVEGRKGHCVAFIDDTLYICGGSANDIVLDSIESYNALTEKSTVVGHLIFRSIFAACVAYKDSIYAFGGIDNDGNGLDCVQVFSPIDMTCTCLSTPLPFPYAQMHAVLWKTYAILLGYDGCFIFDFEGETWQGGQQFKTGVLFCGMVPELGRIFVFGGKLEEEVGEDEDFGMTFTDKVKYVRVSSIVNNESANWKAYCHLPKPFGVYISAKMNLIS